MIRAMVVLAALTLTACGVDGDPQPPAVSAKQTFGYNSKTGSFSNTTLSFTFGG